MNKYIPSLQIDSHPYSIATYKLSEYENLESVGWMWEEFGLENEWCSTDAWYTVYDSMRPDDKDGCAHLRRNVRAIYAEKVMSE